MMLRDPRIMLQICFFSVLTSAFKIIPPDVNFGAICLHYMLSTLRPCWSSVANSEASATNKMHEYCINGYRYRILCSAQYEYPGA